MASEISISEEYLAKTSPAEKLIMIAPSVTMIPSIDTDSNYDLKLGAWLYKNIGKPDEEYYFALDFRKIYPSGKFEIEQIDGYGILRAVIRLTPLDTRRPIVFEEGFQYKFGNKGYDAFGNIFYMVEADDGNNSVYIWYYSQCK
jgi:hypothetical protein